MSADRFSLFYDDLIIELAKRAESGSSSVGLIELCGDVLPDRPVNWDKAIGKRLQKESHATLAHNWDSENPKRLVRITSEGIAYAERVRSDRAPKAILDRLAADRTQKLLNVGAFGVSIISLAIAVVALFRSGS